ncbi:pentatricopeptide repeat-containing protein 1, mitochondrial [Bombus vosnesenskii]|uniref:Pentatricopeptide repeat-containing protein 1, mitochondrial n=1 Tax=Bombus vosnesenskii TaxID=207650 RepID=A0A6J3LS71_9HYME|nr:pentatricopeptide repeat-containing protein 1, mitochondrial [Bombus vosnesenskii]
MFFFKKSCFPKTETITGYVNDRYYSIKRAKQFLYSLQIYNSINYTNNRLCCDINQFGKKYILNTLNKDSLSHFSIFNKKFCERTLSEDINTFGNLSYEKYEKIEMDKAEKEEKRFTEKVIAPKKQRLSYGDYCKLIKSHLHNKNLQLALNILDLMKENGDKPNLYMYRLLLSGFAQQGDVEQCFKLFKNIRERGLTPNAPVYNSLLNACAETNDTQKALDRLSFLREYFYKRNIDLSDIHYATLIRAYGRHNQILTAFEIADEAKDKGIFTQDIIAALFHAIINDKENGLKYGLVLWHKMRISKIQPTIFHYNLLLRTIRDTKFGDLKVNDIIVPELIETQIQLSETGRPDLLDFPPVLTTSLISVLRKNNYFISNNRDSRQQQELNIDTIGKNPLLTLNLNDILQKNRLLLFGGIDKLLKRMKNDNVQPNTKTITLMLDLLPPTIESENSFFRYIVKNKLKVDITSFNMLIKRRCLRKKYEAAKEVLNNIQFHHLIPNIVTFGVLAIGCRMHKDGRELLEQMETIGYAPNYMILETLIFNACSVRNFTYVLYLMKYISENRIEPSQQILNILEKFDELMLQIIRNEDKYKYKAINEIMKDYNNFKIKYENWKEEVQ